jgi:hypothetical protein
MGKGEDELGVENLPRACYRLLKNRGLSLSVHFYMILPATLNSRPVFLQVRGALTTSEQRHVFPSSCEMGTQHGSQGSCAQDDNFHGDVLLR